MRKRSRAEIRHQAERVIRNRTKTWQRFVDTEVEGGRFRDRKPFDCGNTKCGLCRNNWGHKVPRRKVDWEKEL